MPAAANAPRPSSLAGEWGNICVLLLLYTLQGIPMGLGRVVLLTLKERGASYAEIGTFSLQAWPFSLKLLWAPLVDTLYIERCGRRKTWLVPAQLLIGLTAMCASAHIESLLEKPAILPLTLLFLSMNFLCATQDIAVDGWALTMLRKENAAYQATCNAAGQTVGFTLGWTGVTAMNQMGLLDLSGFLYYSGAAFVAVTLAIALLKREAPARGEEEPCVGLAEAYRSLYLMLRLAPVRALVAVLFTWKLAFAVVDSVAPLKFQERGVPKEHMTYLGSALMPLEMVLPVLATPMTSGQMPFNLALWVYPLKVAVVPLTALLVYATPPMEPFPWRYWTSMAAVAVVSSVSTEWMFVSQIALFAKVSDPALGGTYMSFLNTMANLGQRLPPTATFFLVDRLTCVEDGCHVKVDGFFAMTAACAAFGVAWYALARGPVRRMQLRDVKEWRVDHQKRE